MVNLLSRESNKFDSVGSRYFVNEVESYHQSSNHEVYYHEEIYWKLKKLFDDTGCFNAKRDVLNCSCDLGFELLVF